MKGVCSDGSWAGSRSVKSKSMAAATAAAALSAGGASPPRWWARLHTSISRACRSACGLPTQAHSRCTAFDCRPPRQHKHCASELSRSLLQSMPLVSPALKSHARVPSSSAVEPLIATFVANTCYTLYKYMMMSNQQAAVLKPVLA